MVFLLTRGAFQNNGFPAIFEMDSHIWVCTDIERMACLRAAVVIDLPIHEDAPARDHVRASGEHREAGGQNKASNVWLPSIAWRPSPRSDKRQVYPRILGGNVGRVIFVGSIPQTIHQFLADGNQCSEEEAILLPDVAFAQEETRTTTNQSDSQCRLLHIRQAHPECNVGL